MKVHPVFLSPALLWTALALGASGLQAQEPPPRPWLGAMLDLRYTAAPRPGEDAFHLIVDAVHDGGPAEAGGLLPGDQIVAVDGDRVTYGTWMRSYGRLQPGDPLNLRVRRRDGRFHDLVLVAQNRPDSLARGSAVETIATARSRFFRSVDSLLVVVTSNIAAGGSSQTLRVRVRRPGDEPGSLDSLQVLQEGLRERLRSIEGPSSAPRLLRATEHVALPQVMAPWVTGDAYIFGGAQVRTVDGSLAAFFGTGEGALVTNVLSSSPAAQAGFLPGDVIAAVGNRAIPSAEYLREVLAVVPTPFRVTVIRQGNSVVLRFPEPDSP